MGGRRWCCAERDDLAVWGRDGFGPQAVKEVIGRAAVVLCTNAGAADGALAAAAPDGFDVVVIDEAAMALEV